MIISISSKVGCNASSEKRTGSCLFYERLLSAILPPHSVAANKIVFMYLFAVIRKKEFLFMRKFLGLKSLTSRELCTLAMLLSITFIMGTFFTVRIGETIKIPTKFIPIAISAMLFGPVWGGILGVMADILAYFVNPVGAFLPQITFVEFLYGFTYGIALYRIDRNFSGYFRAIICVILQIILLHFLLTSYFLIPIMGAVSFDAVLAVRLIPALINLCLQLLGVSFIVFLSPTLKKISGRLK